jgi:hypothetical protein
MRAIEAKTFSGYGRLQQIELAKPQPAKDKVLVGSRRHAARSHDPNGWTPSGQGTADARQ